MLSEVVQDVAGKSVLCWLATVDALGRPNVSPKEVFAVFDEKHLVIANIASPSSSRNIATNPWVCVSFIDVFVQKGFKVVGIGRYVKRADPEFARWSTPLHARAGNRFLIHGVIVVQVDSVEAIVAPSYRFFPNETSEESQVASAMKTYGVKPALEKN